MSHLRYDAPLHARHARARRHARKAVRDLLAPVETAPGATIPPRAERGEGDKP